MVPSPELHDTQVRDSTCLDPLNVISFISCYVLFNEIWYFLLASSINASILGNFSASGDEIIAKGKLNDTACVVDG